LYLEGLCLLLKKQEGIEVTGSSLTAEALIKTLPTLQIDILLLDVHLPDMEEEELLKTIRQIKPDLKVLYLTMMRGTRYIHKLMKYGLQGYLLKNTGIEELRTAIQQVAAGGTYYSKEINIMDATNDFRNTITIDDKQVGEILSKREIEILKLICKGIQQCRNCRKTIP
jgi:DNA-binding NarL/FixJ family response regulator